MHLSNTEFVELKKIYEEYKNKEVTKSQLNCNSCRVKIVKELAKDYIATKEKELQEIKEDEPKKKVGRPKKIDIERTITNRTY